MVAVLAVGSEIVSGQVVNRNASWLSAQCERLRMPVRIHSAVADDRAAILLELNRLATLAKEILVTGGLGPTTDDFTREVVAQWVEKPLEFSNSHWEKIKKFQAEMGSPTLESHKQQCQFPKTAIIHDNSVGTAPGFSVLNEKLGVWVHCFPGPPKELESVWNTDSFLEPLKERRGEESPLTLWTLQCLGRGESLLAEKTEEVFKGANLVLGYRTHLPYVEIKVWYGADQVSEFERRREKLLQILGPYVVAEGQRNPLKDFILRHAIKGVSLRIIETGTEGYVGEKFAELRPSIGMFSAFNLDLQSKFNKDRAPKPLVQEKGMAQVSLFADDAGAIVVEFLSADGKRFTNTFGPEYQGPRARQRALRTGIERAWLWCEGVSA